MKSYKSILPSDPSLIIHVVDENRWGGLWEVNLLNSGKIKRTYIPENTTDFELKSIEDAIEFGKIQAETNMTHFYFVEDKIDKEYEEECNNFEAALKKEIELNPYYAQ